jgi:hypothetical protein
MRAGRFLVPVLFVAMVSGCVADEEDLSDPEPEELGDLQDEEIGSTQLAIFNAAYFEGEHLSGGYYNYPIAVGYGWGAWGNAFLQLNWQGGPGYVSWYAPHTGWYRSRVRTAGAVCNGYPVIAPGWAHPVGNWVYLGQGWHSVGVGFQNDYYGGGCDRNLWLDAVWIEAY